MFCGDGDGAIRATDDGAIVIEGIGVAEVDDGAGVFRAAREGDGGAGLNAKGLIGFGAGDAWGGGGGGALAAPDVDGAG